MRKYAYKNYIFDFYGTLVSIHTDEDSPLLWDRLAQLYQAYGVDYTESSLRDAYLQLVQEAEAEVAKAYDVTYPEIDLQVIFAQLYLQGEKIPGAIVAKFSLRNWSHFVANTFRILSRKHLAAYPHTLAVLRQLKQEGARIYLLSNAQAAFAQAEIELTGCRAYLDGIYLSSDYHMRKPQPDYLLQVLKDHHLEPAETVMIGNDLTSDMAVAEAVGIDGILLNTFPYSAEQLEKENTARHPVITDMEELLADEEN